MIIYHLLNSFITMFINHLSNTSHFMLIMISTHNFILISNISMLQIFSLRRNTLSDYYNIMTLLWKILNKLKIFKHDIMIQNINILNLSSKIKFNFLFQIFARNVSQRNSIENILTSIQLSNILNFKSII